MSKSYHYDDDELFSEYGFKQHKMNPYNKDKDRRKSRISPREVILDDEDVLDIETSANEESNNESTE